MPLLWSFYANKYCYWCFWETCSRLWVSKTLELCHWESWYVKYWLTVYNLTCFLKIKLLIRSKGVKNQLACFYFSPYFSMIRNAKSIEFSWHKSWWIAISMERLNIMSIDNNGYDNTNIITRTVNFSTYLFLIIFTCFQQLGPWL